jgi:ribonuclease P protein component
MRVGHIVETYAAADRVKRRGEFRRIQSGGVRVHTRRFILMIHPTLVDGAHAASAPSRLGITVTKKVGNAVARNRIKRVLREVFRLERRLFPQGFDFVVVAKRGLDPVHLEDVRQELRGTRTAIERATRKALQRFRDSEARRAASVSSSP